MASNNYLDLVINESNNFNQPNRRLSLPIVTIHFNICYIIYYYYDYSYYIKLYIYILHNTDTHCIKS